MTKAFQPAVPYPLLDAATLTASTGSTFALPYVASLLTYQSVYASAPSAVNITIQGSSDNSNWQTLATLTTTTGEQGNITTALPYIRAKINSNTGGSTVTIYLTAKPYTIQGSARGFIHQYVATLNNTQIKALPTTAISLVSAPGANKVIIPVNAGIITNFSAGAYVAAAGSSWLLQWAGGVYASSPQNIQSTLQAAATSLVTLPGLPYQYDAANFGAGTVIGNGQIGVASTVTNKDLQIKDDWNGVSDYTGGNAANTMNVSLVYLILNILTGQFE